MKHAFRSSGLLAATVLSFSACSGCGPDAPASVAASPQWIHQATPRSPVAVVFIHGIFGDGIQTWTNPSGGRFFDYLEQSEYGDRLDVYAFGFNSRMFESGSDSIDEAARALHQFLQRDEILEYERVVVVAHSMGGLVAMQELTSHPEEAAKVPLMVFYATPQEGSQITSIARHVVDNDALQQMLLVDNNLFLRELNNEWTELRHAGNAPRVICAYEKKPTHGVMIVPWSSATRICDEAPPAIPGSDHLSIVKPGSDRDLAVVLLLNAIEKYVAPHLDASAWEISNVDVGVDQWTFHLENPNDYNTAAVTNRSAVRQDYRILRTPQLRLHISPEAELRRVEPGQSDQLRMFPVGDLLPEYTFKLQLGASAPRLFRVVIDDYDAALAQRAQRNFGVLAMLDTAVDAGAFATLSADEQRGRLAATAFEYASQQSPGLDAASRWVVSADMLARVGLPDAAAVAFDEGTAGNPVLAADPAVAQLGQSIDTLAGERPVWNPQQGVRLLSVSTVDYLHATAAAQRRLGSLAGKLQRFAAFENDALVIKGDLELGAGDQESAIRFYREAGATRRNPGLEPFLRTPREPVDSAVHPAFDSHRATVPARREDPPER